MDHQVLDRVSHSSAITSDGIEITWMERRFFLRPYRALQYNDHDFSAWAGSIRSFQMSIITKEPRIVYLRKALRTASTMRTKGSAVFAE